MRIKSAMVYTDGALARICHCLAVPLWRTVILPVSVPTKRPLETIVARTIIIGWLECSNKLTPAVCHHPIPSFDITGQRNVWQRQHGQDARKEPSQINALRVAIPHLQHRVWLVCIVVLPVLPIVVGVWVWARLVLLVLLALLVLAATFIFIAAAIVAAAVGIVEVGIIVCTCFLLESAVALLSRFPARERWRLGLFLFSWWGLETRKTKQEVKRWNKARRQRPPPVSRTLITIPTTSTHPIARPIKATLQYTVRGLRWVKFFG